MQSNDIEYCINKSISNSDDYLEKIKKEMVLINKCKDNKKGEKFDKKDIINYVLAILGMIISIILAIIFQ